MTSALKEGEDVVIIDRKGREYLFTLTSGKSFSTHKGTISHDEIMGKDEGDFISTPGGENYTAFRPTFNQFVMNLKRKAQIIYPKDIGPILLWGDIYPGAFIIEGGAGWGALSIALLRAIGKEGRLVTYEVREDFRNASVKNIRRFMGEPDNHEIKLQDIYEGIDERNVDRIILDVPEPWKAVHNSLEALRQGGILLSYLPTILQVREFCESVRESGGYVEPEVFEVTHRPWNVKGKSVRPVSWTFSHSAFITVTRKTSTDVGSNCEM